MMLKIDLWALTQVEKLARYVGRYFRTTGRHRSRGVSTAQFTSALRR